MVWYGIGLLFSENMLLN